ncbi:MAG: orotate phosphoribosyltransferase [Deltaproteobacteria bacterium]|nr:MAG: orotate phosphoribosyltransferase [Deltaproteobacteria bacterium]
MKARLIELLKKYSVKYSTEKEFLLASGKKSRFYINCKQTILRAEGLYLTGNLVLNEIKELEIDAVGGLTFGADPVAMATAFASASQKNPVNAFSIRKEKKDHGISRWIEGSVKKGGKAVIIDDVATTGGSAIKAIERAKSEGLDIVGAVILVDREEGGLENIKKYVPFAKAVIKRSELV